MSGSTGSSTVENSGPPQQFLDAYENVVNQAQGVAAQPLEQYTGQIVAPLTSQQQQAFTQVGNEQGIAKPYISQASNDYSAATKPIWSGVQQFSPTAVQQYESPYTSDVVNSTQAEFNNQNQQQQQQLQSQEVNQGAWGGNRNGVAAGILANQQQLAQAPVIANLENTGYTTAENEFNTEQQSQIGANEANAWLNSQAGAGTAALGGLAETSALTDANALLQSGSLQQTQNQEELSVPYEQFEAQQAYPFQTTGWLANVAEGAGSLSGGTSTSTQQPSTLSTLLGIGSLAASLFLKRGGGIAGNDNDTYESARKTGTFGGGGGIMGYDIGGDVDSAPSGLDWGNFYNNFLAPHEGGYVKDDGNGTPTNFGVNEKDDGVDVSKLTKQSAGDILRNRYYSPSGADKLPAPLAAIETDTAVNMGVGAARKLLAQSGGDPDTYLKLRGDRYEQIAENNPSKEKYLKGWLNRNSDLDKYVHSLMGPSGVAASDDHAAPASVGPAQVTPVPDDDMFPGGIAGGQSPDEPASGIAGAIPDVNVDGVGPLSFDRYKSDYAPPAAPDRSPSTNSADLRNHAVQMALLAAGFGILGSGNIGKGGLEGLKAYQDAIGKADTSDEKQQEAANEGNYRKAALDQQGKSLADRALEAAATAKREDARLDLTESHNEATERISQQNADRQQKQLDLEMGVSGAGMPGTPAAAAAAAGVRGADYLKTLPSADQNMVKSMVEGRQAPPTAFALTKPYWQMKLAEAQQYDPTFDQTLWGARFGAHKDMFGGGKSYQMLNAASTAINHLGHLKDQVDDVSGVRFPLVGNLINRGVNAYEQESGKPGVNAYNDTLGHVAEETTRLYRGTGGNESDVQRDMAGLSPNLSSDQKKAGVANTIDLIFGKVQPMADTYNKAMGTNYPTGYFLSPQARGRLQSMGYDPDTGEKHAAGASAQPSHGASGAPKFTDGQMLQQNGHTYKVINGVPVPQP